MLAVYTSRNFPLFAIFLCPVMGRPRKYATDAARKQARAQKAVERRKLKPSDSVYLGKVRDLWIQTKHATGMTSDLKFAICLLDRLVNLQSFSCRFNVACVI